MALGIFDGIGDHEEARNVWNNNALETEARLNVLEQSTFTSFVNAQTVSVFYHSLFDVEVFLLDGTRHLEGHKIEVNGEIFNTVGTLSLDESGAWTIEADRNAYKSETSALYVVFDYGQGSWVIGELSDHNQGGHAGVDKTSLQSPGFLPVSYGEFVIDERFDLLSTEHFDKCEPIISFNQLNSTVTIDFGGTEQTGFVVAR